MDRMIQSLDKLREINADYPSLSNDVIEDVRTRMEHAKVCIPVIGKFSSGKSALVNTILGYSQKLLKEDITPETAVPTEITYSSAEKERAFVIYNDKTQKEITLEDYRQLEVDADNVHCIRLELQNTFLQSIPDVMIVDMPGFESGYEVHNKAIDNYVSQSLAYIVAFPADDMAVRSSVGNILKELCLHDMPICVVITKVDKVDYESEDFEQAFAHMKTQLKSYIGEREVTYCRTSSFLGDASEAEYFLESIQEHSKEIIERKFRPAVLSCIDTTESYLNTTLNSSEMSESELTEQEEKLHRDFERMSSKFSGETKAFQYQISDCAEEIKADVQMALNQQKSKFVAMALNGQDIKETINMTVRNAVTSGIQKRFIPRVQKYLKEVNTCLNGDSVGDVTIPFSFDAEDVGKNMTTAIVGAIAMLFVGGPILAVIFGALVALKNKIAGDKKREENKQRITAELEINVFPQILSEIEIRLKNEITKQIDLIKSSIEDEIKKQKNAHDQALDDIRKKMCDEQADKQQLETNIRAALEQIDRMKCEL